MAAIDPETDLGTHEVTNQPPARGDRDLWQDDPALREAATRTGAHREVLSAYGRTLGRSGMRQAARDANRHLPELTAFDPGGRRLDEVRFHPAYHRFMETSIGAGYAALAWEEGDSGKGDGGKGDGGGGHATHAAMVYLASQVEPGHCCPLTMTYAAVPLLASAQGHAGGLADVWLPKLVSRRYDPTIRPVAQKIGATLGMAMTEKQGGSDVRATTTRAERQGDDWRLTGHKWFCSAPMSDGFMTLAQAPGGLTCFLVPRWLEGARNGIRLLRLKDKLGNRSNASAEIEFTGARAHRIGPEGHGIRTIVEMVHRTRLDTAIAPAGLMQAALAEAHHWVQHRSAFQRRLIDQPLMRTVLADLTLDREGALALGMHVAGAFDRPTEQDRAFARIGVALAKFLANKLCPMVIGEAMEILGGMGYVEDTPLPMLFRESPLNGIWEGSGNVICLDVLRTLRREPLAGAALDADLDLAVGRNRRYDIALSAHRDRWPAPPDEAEARWYVERTALLLSASVLLRHAPDVIADAFVRTRISGEMGRIAGSVNHPETGRILNRISPEC